VENLPNSEGLFEGLGLFFPALPQSVPQKISTPVVSSEKWPDIAALTARMARHDELAYRQFYDLYFNRLLRYLLVLTGGREDTARDALQATMPKIVRHVRRFDSDDVFWSWLTVLARNSVVDFERKRKRYLALLERFFESGQPAGLSANSDAEGRFIFLLEKNLAALPPEDRDLIERKYFESDSVREIARELGATEKAVDSRLVRIRRQLKESILEELKNETGI
jgi:RNA polymerase sigma-70 factor (ECF subfamily)